MSGLATGFATHIGVDAALVTVASTDPSLFSSLRARALLVAARRVQDVPLKVKYYVASDPGSDAVAKMSSPSDEWNNDLVTALGEAVGAEIGNEVSFTGVSVTSVTTPAPTPLPTPATPIPTPQQVLIPIPQTTPPPPAIVSPPDDDTGWFSWLSWSWLATFLLLSCCCGGGGVAVKKKDTIKEMIA